MIRVFSSLHIAFISLLSTLQLQGQSLDALKLTTLLEAAQNSNSEAVIIHHNGKIVAEQYFGIGAADKKIETMSCTKSIVGLVVACMLTDGVLDSLNTPLSTYYPEWRQGRKRNITVEHLVHMTSGIQNDPNAGAEIYPSPDFVQLALAAELSDVPGAVWSYNNKALNLLAGVVQKITGKRLDHYAAERLFAPIGITKYEWMLDEAGNPHVMAGCQITPPDFLKMGLLLLNKGTYNGDQVISEENIALLVKPTEQYKGYGLLWWLDHEHTISIVDDAIINSMQEGGVATDFIAKARLLKGTYGTNEEFYAKVEQVFGPDPWQHISDQLPGDLRLRKKNFEGAITYRADGYLGNYIIVDPEKRMVAIRMISHASHNGPRDNFQEFQEMVLGLY